MSESEEHEDLAPAEAKPPRSDADFERHDPLEAEAPPRSPTPVVVPRWVQLVVLPLVVLGLYVVLRAPGPVVLLFIIAAVIALILNPVVGLLHRAHLPRGLAIAAVYLGFFAVLGAAPASCSSNPVSDQVSTLQRRRPVDRRLGEPSARRPAGLLRPQGHQRRDQEAGPDARWRRCSGKVVGGTDKIVSFGTGLLETLVTAGFGLILVLVLSVYMLIYGRAHRRARARGHAARGRHPRRRLPGARVSARSPATCAASCCSASRWARRGRRAVHLRRHRDLPRRQDLRARVRRLLRADGADPVRRAVPRRAAADARRAVLRTRSRRCGSGCCSSPCSRSRATSSRRRSSATRCGSTRCW